MEDQVQEKKPSFWQKAKEKCTPVLSKIAGAYSSFSKKPWRYAIYLPLLLLAFYAIFFIFNYSTAPYDPSSAYRGYASSGTHDAFFVCLTIYFVAIIVVEALLFAFKKNTPSRIAFGFVLISIGVMLIFTNDRYMNYEGFKHDYGYYYQGGHWSLIYEIFNTGKWPTPQTYNQSYQPKLWHQLMASIMKFHSLFLKPAADNAPFVWVESNKDLFPLWTNYEYTLLETTRIYINFYSALTIWGFYKCFKELKLDGAKLIIATLLAAFVPALWYMPMYGNNDMLALTFAIFAFYFALRYHNKRSWVDVVFTAIFIGLGMSTKLSAALIAFPVAFIFLLELLKVVKGLKKEKDQKAFKMFVIQMVVFAVIVFPLGLGLHIYNKVKYGLPIGYVMDLERWDGGYYESQQHIHLEYYGFWNRFVLFPAQDLGYGHYLKQWLQERYLASDGTYRWVPQWGLSDFSVWTAFLKTALFGEWTFYLTGYQALFADIAYVTWILLGVIFEIGAIFYVVRFIYRLIKKEKFDWTLFVLMLIFFATNAFSYIYFNYRYPVGCSENARYAMLLFIPIQIVIASFLVDAPKTLLALSTKKKAAVEEAANKE